MKKKYFFLFLILIILSVVLSACGLFGGKDGKTELTEDMLRYSNSGSTSAYVYTGEPIDGMLNDIRVYANGDFVDMDYFDVEITDNVSPGTASIKITAKKNNPTVKGSVTIHFDIVADSSKHCEAVDDLAALLADPGYSAVQMWCNYSVSEDVTITVPEGKTLALLYGYGFENHGTIENYGTVVMEGAHLSTRGRRETEFYNYGTFNNHATLTIKDYATFNDMGTFTSDNEVTSLGTIYLLDEDKSFLVNGQGGVRYVRHPISAADVSVAEIVFRQGQNQGYAPSVTVARSRENVNVTYRGNDHAGMAEATVTVGEINPFYYGEVTVPFEIKKGTANAASYDELIELVLSENYDKYEITALIVPAGENFTFPTGETLTVKSSLLVNGTMSALGILSCSDFTVAASGVFSNDGSLFVKGNSFAVYGTFRNGEQGDWDFGTKAVFVAEGGIFVNQSDVADKRIELRRGSTLRNEGALDFRVSSFFGTVVNTGTAVFSGTVYQYADGVLNNEQGGRVVFEEDSDMRGSFVNAGTFVNLARLAFDENAIYSNVGAFDNSEGGVWGFAALAGVNENFHLKKHLTDSDVDFHAEYAETIYNKRNQIPAFTVDGEAILTSEYRQSVFFKEENKIVQECVKTGEYVVTVTIQNKYFPYAGSLDYIYTILPATIRVDSEREFKAVYSDAGYDRIILDADIVVKNVYVGINCTLDLNGHRLTVQDGASSFNKNYFMIYGALMGGAAVDPENFTPSESVASVIVGQYAYLYNYGSFANDGFVYVKGGGDFLANAVKDSTSESGTVVNNGVIYTPTIMTASGSGVVFLRKSVTEVKNLIQLPAVSYDGTEQTPVPTMTYGGAGIDMSRFDLTYSLNVNAGTALLSMEVADPFDPDFYGSGYLNFTIERGVKEVFTMNDLIAGAANENYAILRLASSFMLTANITLSADQTLDLDSYEITTAESKQITLIKGCRLILTAADPARLDQYAFVADEITLTADITDAVAIQTSDGYTVPIFAGTVNYKKTVVHLDGHSFAGGLSFSNGSVEGFDITFENSSETASTIGDDVGDYAFRFETSSKDTNLLLRNITVYGAYYGGGYNADVYLSAEKCNFLASRTTQSAYALRINPSVRGDGTYTDCVFEGANTVYISRGRHSQNGEEVPAYYFDNCEFYAYGPHDATSKTDCYGCVVLLDNYANRGIYPKFTSSYLYSAHGNIVQINYNAVNVHFLIDDASVIEHPEGNFYALTPLYQR